MRASPSGLLVVTVLGLSASACASRGPREFDVATPAAAAADAGAPEAPGPSLAGTWELNMRETMAAMRSAGGGMPMEGGPGMGGRRTGAGGMPPMGAGPGGRPGQGPPGAPGEAGEMARRLVIEQTDSTLSLARPGARPLVLWFDGREVYERGRLDDDVTPVRGVWRRGRFEVRRQVSDMRVLVEAYELLSEGRRLVVRVRTEGGPRDEESPREMRRIYNRAAPGGIP